MEQRVVITGLGVITPVGNNISDFWNNLVAGYCGIDFIKGYENYELPVRVAGQVKDFKPEENGLEKNDIRRNDIYCQYALAAAYQAMQDSGLVSGENVAPERLGVYIGSGIGGMHTFFNESEKLLNEGVRRISPLFVPMMISNIASGNVAIKYNAQGVCLPVVTACATGTHAAGEAYRAIKHGYADAIICGGSEACIHPLAIGGFANSKALSRSEDPKKASIPFNVNRNGFVMGEGAGVLVLESLENAQKRGAKIYAEVVGYGNSCDAHHVTAPSPFFSRLFTCFLHFFKSLLHCLHNVNYNDCSVIITCNYFFSVFLHLYNFKEFFLVFIVIKVRLKLFFHSFNQCFSYSYLFLTNLKLWNILRYYLYFINKEKCYCKHTFISRNYSEKLF